MKLLSLVSLVAFTAAALDAQAAPERSAIQVALSVPAPAAFERITTAFLQAGLQVAAANAAAGTITSAPVRRQQGVARLELVYRANILAPAGDSTVLVVLNGTYVVRDATGQLAPEQQPITSRPHGPLAHADAWEMLERIAGLLRGH